MLVYKYAEKHNLAKWVWTLFVTFGPTLVFIPPYIFFIIYANRVYFARFFKRVKQEFGEFNINEFEKTENKPNELENKKSKDKKKA